MISFLIILLALTILVLVGVLVRVLTFRAPQADGRALEGVMAKVAGDALKSAQEQFFSLAHEKFAGERTLAQKDLEHRHDTIKQLVEEIRKDVAASNEKLKASDDARIASFSSVSKEIEMQKGIMGELRASTDDLKRILSNNQMRGAFGEQVAENLLKMAGFVTGQDYVYNKEQESTDTRPDFTIFLPDRTKINIDVKFPFSFLMKMMEVEGATEKEQYKKQFAGSVKQKIKDVLARGYINPEDNTVDFVILFIPNEMIFSYVYDQLNEVWEEAMQKKVILAGPFSFTAILRMVKQAHSNFHYQKNIQHVIGLIHKFGQEYEKFSDSVDVLGDRIDSMKKQYDAMSSTRTRQLTKVIDQIKNQNVLPAGAEEVSSVMGNDSKE